VKGNLSSPLKISDKPKASKTAKHEDYMCPVMSPDVKPKPGQFITSGLILNVTLHW